ncbi:putative protein family UPF0057 [Metarhizium rileyi]|uniref:Plasma membrane proteolipid Pmp3 n=1 Tax=Metarhizium rileyi (strain RCEF 4871) TaxID=1649241 RepID=A0A167DDX5_METRR|nr:putative protein family UPF0057 [Metarhizium rileyi RCEF 4871]TWU72426.1 plasma membrane proteolipid Pmp3 [Metarhizium rileyi]
MPLTASDICKFIFAIILPPLGVFLEVGCGADLLINIVLTIFGKIEAHLMSPFSSLLFFRGLVTVPSSPGASDYGYDPEN